MRSLENDLKEAQRLMRAGDWDAADDLLEQVMSKATNIDRQLEDLKTEVKNYKRIIKQMERRIMTGDR